MFNQTNLQLKPSLPLALILGTPFLSALVLFILISLPLIGTTLLVSLSGLCGYYFLNRYAFLSDQRSIICVESSHSQIFLTDRSGQRYLAIPLSDAIIHPWFSLLSFECEALEEKQTIQHNLSFAALIESLGRRIPSLFIRKEIRHVIICRYNVSCLSEYRRLRVTLNFS